MCSDFSASASKADRPATASRFLWNPEVTECLGISSQIPIVPLFYVLVSVSLFDFSSFQHPCRTLRQMKCLRPILSNLSIFARTTPSRRLVRSLGRLLCARLKSRPLHLQANKVQSVAHQHSRSSAFYSPCHNFLTHTLPYLYRAARKCQRRASLVAVGGRVLLCWTATAMTTSTRSSPNSGTCQSKLPLLHIQNIARLVEKVQWVRELREFLSSELCAQPVEALVQSVALCGARGLDVPLRTAIRYQDV